MRDALAMGGLCRLPGGAQGRSRRSSTRLCLFRARRLPPQREGRTGHGPGTEECRREHPNEGFSEEGLRSPGTCSGRSDTVANATFSPTMPATSWLRGVSTILSTTSRKRSRNPHQHAKRGRLNELSSSQRLLE